MNNRLKRLAKAKLAAGDPELEAAFDSIGNTAPTPRLCLTCDTPIPLGSRKDKQYCNQTCRARYMFHTEKGNPVPKIPRVYNPSPFKAPLVA